MDTVSSILKNIKKFLSKISNWIISLFNSSSDNDTLLSPYMYDIYYHFKILEKDGKLNGLIVHSLYIDFFDIRIQNTEYLIRIYDISGSLIRESTLFHQKEHIGTIEIKQGIYIYQILDSNGSCLQAGKLSKTCL